MSQPAIPAHAVRHRNWWFLLSAIIFLAAWLPSVWNDFVEWDDLTLIIGNPHFNPPTIGSVIWYWRHPFFNLYQPLTCTLWGSIAHLGWVEAPDQFNGHLNPYPFHFASVVLHAIAAIAVYQILKQAVRDRIAALLGAMVFAMHPVQVEAVAFAGAMNNPLFGALGLIAVWQYLKFVQTGRWLHNIMGLAALMLAMLAKPTAVVIPAMAWTLDWAIFRRPMKDLLNAILPWFLLVIPCIILTKLLQSGATSERVAWIDRPLIVGDAIAFYLRQLIAPVHLGIDYGRSPHHVLAMRWVYVIWMVPAALVICGFLVRRRLPLVWAGIVIFIVGLLPNSGLLPFDQQLVSTTTDRYLYIAMLGPALVAAVMIAKFPKPAFYSAAVLCIVALSVCTALQVRVWQNGQTLFEHAIAVNPNSWFAHCNLAFVEANRSPQEAIADCRTAIRLKPNFALAYHTLGSLLMQQHQVAEAQRAFAEAHRLEPNEPMYAANYLRSLKEPPSGRDSSR